MPTLSASDYTQFLKFKAASATGIQPSIQTRANVSTSQSLINANLLTSQAAYVVNPSTANVYNQTAVVTGVTTTPITTALTNILTNAAAPDGVNIVYTSSQPHGLTTGTTVTIAGFVGGFPDRNISGAVTVNSATEFQISTDGYEGPVDSSGTGRIVNRVYYTTSVAHGLVVGDVISVTGASIAPFSATNKTVVSVPTATTFVLDSATTGSEATGATGSITGVFYYTTNVFHGFYAGFKNVTLTGLTDSTYNFSLKTIYRVPSSTVFVLQNGGSGTPLTGESGLLQYTVFGNPQVSLTGLARVRPLPVVQTRSDPKAKSTLSWTSGSAGSIGTTSSSKIQQPGGLPLMGRVGTYSRPAQGAGWGGNNH